MFFETTKKLFWLSIIALAAVQASNADDTVTDEDMVQAAVSTHYADSFDECVAAYMALAVDQPINLKMVTFCKQISK